MSPPYSYELSRSVISWINHAHTNFPSDFSHFEGSNSSNLEEDSLTSPPSFPKSSLLRTVEILVYNSTFVCLVSPNPIYVPYPYYCPALLNQSNPSAVDFAQLSH